MHAVPAAHEPHGDFSAVGGGVGTGTDPGCGGAHLTICGRHRDVAAEADDVVELQLLGE